MVSHSRLKKIESSTCQRNEAPAWEGRLELKIKKLGEKDENCLYKYKSKMELQASFRKGKETAKNGGQGERRHQQGYWNPYYI